MNPKARAMGQGSSLGSLPPNRLSGSDYPIESASITLDGLSNPLERGTRGLQKKVLGRLF